ncbi:Transcription factor E3 [Wickerhamiella sorbophila]|uniref:Transcription factor E3 n=1 Tax=Wickerhamiella sorbophila TaxID=45607 RepID=A0A2T0FHB5_9ASCO|nr:Transcription factor E3 [Wickerhamiella sorbophila]PRT54393.1 Transcription factor E3 [Wickerhamiella sorbophila]
MLNPLQADLYKLRTEHYPQGPSGVRVPASPPRQNSDIPPEAMPWMNVGRVIPPPVAQAGAPDAIAMAKPKTRARSARSEPNTRRRRSNHNLVEQRRREAIAENIRMLDELLPESVELPESRSGKLDQHCKSNVLRRGVAYVTMLKSEQTAAAKRIKELEQRVAQLEDLLEGAYCRDPKYPM